MDALETLIALAHLRVRLALIERNPQILKELRDMANDKLQPLQIRKPMELAGLKSRLARAKKQQTDIETTGQRYDAVMDEIDMLHDASKMHVGDLEMYKGELRRTVEGMVAGSNGGDPLDGQDGQSSDSTEADHGDAPPVGQVISSTTVS
jgi:hypothetical protein